MYAIKRAGKSACSAETEQKERTGPRSWRHPPGSPNRQHRYCIAYRQPTGQFHQAVHAYAARCYLSVRSHLFPP
jgi:hypothetical protein